MNTSTVGQHTHTQTHGATHTYTAPVVCLLWSQQFKQLTGGLVCFLRHETETEREGSCISKVLQSDITLMHTAVCVYLCACVRVCTDAQSLALSLQPEG